MGDAQPLWTSHDIAGATGGVPYGAPFTASGISIDTRTLSPGDLFVALAGTRDGETFAPTAVARGAAGLLTRKVHDGAGVGVEDTLRALERLGAAARLRAPRTRRCAVTGSVGKTSVTQALAAALRPSGRTHASVESYNNHIGVPLTLARMPQDADYGVFELGMNHAGEIAALTRQVRPQVCVVTTVGSAHVENFPDGELGVAKAKAEIFEGLEPGGVAVLNADAPFFDLLRDTARAAGAQVWSFGSAAGSRARILATAASDEGVAVTADIAGERVSARVGAPGAHWALNLLATLLAAEALGAARAGALEALASFTPLAGRGQRLPLAIGAARVTLIDESYNANPQSMGAALQTLGAVAARGRKLAVLTDMLEIGPGAPAAHEALEAPLAAAGVAQVFGAGDLMGLLIERLPRGGVWRPSAEELAPLVLNALQDGDVILVKGSKGSKASLVVDALKLAAGGGTPVEGR